MKCRKQLLNVSFSKRPQCTGLRCHKCLRAMYKMMKECIFTKSSQALARMLIVTEWHLEVEATSPNCKC